MTTEPLIYKPRYSTRTRVVLGVFPAMFFSMLCLAPFSLATFPVAFWLLVLLMGFCTSVIPFLTIREIRFLDEMVVRRHFLPDLFFTLEEITGVEPQAILAGGKRMRLPGVVNAQELLECFQRWKAARLLKTARRKVETRPTLYPQRGYGSYASFWGLIAGVILVMMDLPWLAMDPRWQLAGAFLFVYVMYLYLVPRMI